MEWKEIIIKIPVKDIEKAGSISQMVVPYGIYIEDYSNLENEAREIAHIDLIDEDLLKKDRQNGKIHIYVKNSDNPIEVISFLKERLSAENIKYAIEMNKCKEEDWINNWKKYFHPIKVGKNILICPTWEECEQNSERKVLKLDPGLAFGTGTHETTRLCLELLEKYVKPGNCILDVGCGSGILSVAALLMGAKNAVGVDIDDLAVKTAVENANLNNVTDRFECICGNLTDKVNGNFDIVVANIVADAIISLNEDINKYMSEDSVYIMSGIIDSRVAEVKDSLAKNFEIIDEKSEKGWFALAAILKR